MTEMEDDMMEPEDTQQTSYPCNTDTEPSDNNDTAGSNNVDMGDAAPPEDEEDDGEIDDDDDTNDRDQETSEKAEKDEDLEEGECSSDDEPTPPVIEEVKEEKRKSDKKHHRRTRSRSRDRHKRSKRDRERKELNEDERKKREVLRKLKALEENMGLDWEEEEEEEEMPMMTEEDESGSSESRSRSGSSSGSVSPTSRRREREQRKWEREERHERKRKWREDRERRKEKLCHMFMQGKCQKTAKECMYSHNAEPPQVWELCKFYLRDRCAKRDKCLYLHKGFPCKFFHTGRDCGETKESCQFSHEPLNDMTRTLLLKHIETAPKDILGEFPRMTRTEAANSIFQTEAKNKGWITEGPDAVRPPVEATVDERMETGEAGEGEGAGDVKAPSHIKLDPIQEKLLRSSQQGRWGGPGQEAGPGGAVDPPLAVQQAMAMGLGPRGGQGQFEAGAKNSGIQSHGVTRHNGAFSQPQPGPGHTQRRQTVGLLGAAPESHWSGSPFGPGGGYGAAKQPPGLMDVKVNEEEVHSYLIKQRIVAAKVHEEFNEPSDDDEVAPPGDGGDETPEVTPPNSREGSPIQNDQNVPPNLPKAQMKLLQRIQQKQKDIQDSDSNDQPQEEGQNDTNWYSEDEDAGDKAAAEAEQGGLLGAPFTLNNLNLPSGLTNMLTAIKQGTATATSSPAQAQEAAAPPPKADKRPDPRRQNRNDPRNRAAAAPAPTPPKQSEEELERKKDERIMDLDLGSFFGDLELPPLTVSPERTEEEKNFTDALGLPFKPHIIHEVAKEIDASYGSHSPIDWSLRAVVCPKPDYSDIKHLFSNAQLEADPRLRKFAKSGMAKLKELPLPSFPTPKTDPRLARKEAVTSSPGTKVADRRRSSEDSEAGQVYNPAKELSRARLQQQTQPQQPPRPHDTSEAYSPGQEYPGHPAQPGYTAEAEHPAAGDHYSPGYEDHEEGYGGPPPNYPPYDPHQGYPPPPGPGHWGPPEPRYPHPPQGRGFPGRGPPPPMDPYYQGPPPGPYGAPYGPPRGKFNGPRRGNFPPNRGGGGGFGQQKRKDPRKRQ